MTGPGRSPTWNGARIRSRTPSGTSPPWISDSVPRLTPERTARTSASPAAGDLSCSRRSSPRPGSTVQYAVALPEDSVDLPTGAGLAACPPSCPGNTRRARRQSEDATSQREDERHTAPSASARRPGRPPRTGDVPPEAWEGDDVKMERGRNGQTAGTEQSSDAPDPGAEPQSGYAPVNGLQMYLRVPRPRWDAAASVTRRAVQHRPPIRPGVAGPCAESAGDRRGLPGTRTNGRRRPSTDHRPTWRLTS